MGRSNKARRDERRASRQRRAWLLRGIAALVVVGIIVGMALWIVGAARTSAEVAEVGDTSGEWEFIPTQPAIHIESGEPYEPWNTDPPTSGYHYGDPVQPVRAGFYEEQIVPDENLVHSMEHGYIFLWYDCSQLSETECMEVKDGIQRVIRDTDTYKVVGFPREGMDAPIIATSWGVMAKLQSFDYARLVQFVEQNRENSPEPSAP